MDPLVLLMNLKDIWLILNGNKNADVLLLTRKGCSGSLIFNYGVVNEKVTKCYIINVIFYSCLC